MQALYEDDINRNRIFRIHANLLAVPLGEVVDEAASLRQAHQRPGTGVPELGVDHLLRT